MNIRTRVMTVRDDLRYSCKLLKGVVSGYDGLQYPAEGGWYYVPERVGWTRDEDGSYISESHFLDFPDDPYYICVAWKNSTHTPLPVIIGPDDEGTLPIQRFVVTVLESLAFRWHRVRSFETAFEACAYYEHWFSEEEERRREGDGNMIDLALVAPKDRCPECGERRQDKLVWHGDEFVECMTCGCRYLP